ncbi:MAG: plasmid mobilization protein [Nitrososphaera sp.]
MANQKTIKNVPLGARVGQSKMPSIKRVLHINMKVSEIEMERIKQRARANMLKVSTYCRRAALLGGTPR